MPLGHFATRRNTALTGHQYFDGPCSENPRGLDCYREKSVLARRAQNSGVAGPQGNFTRPCLPTHFFRKDKPIFALVDLKMAVNATASPLGFSEFIHHTMPEAWTSMVTFLVSYLGEAGAWVLLTFGSSYAITFYNNVYFNYIYTNGLHEKYRWGLSRGHLRPTRCLTSRKPHRIQNDRRLPKLLEDMAWEKTFGLTGLIGIILVGMPQVGSWKPGPEAQKSVQGLLKFTPILPFPT